MIRRTSLLLLLCGLLLAACTALDEANPYEGVLGRLTVRLRYPGEHASWCREGVEVTATDRQSGNRYTARTDAQGEASFRMPNGLYALAVSDRADSQTLFNGAVEQLRLTAGGEAVAELELRCVRPGGIVIREIYTGGCPATPATGSYVYDKYVILHNNDSETRYLDGLCLGMVDPYNSKGASGNYWTSLAPDGGILFRDYASVPDAVWQFPGSGRDFPLAPGADAVVALNGAVDHTATYPLSVNLNGEGYFVCYNETYYPDTRSHPVPGDRIDPARRLRLLKKTGLAKVYVVSNNSPAVILYRAPEGFDLEGYLADDGQSLIVRGSLSYTRIPWEWLIDGVEVFDATGTTNAKRLCSDIDAGAVTFVGLPLGRTLHRRLDEQASEAAGYAIYQDTNNSSDDFYERATQSLRDEP